MHTGNIAPVVTDIYRLRIVENTLYELNRAFPYKCATQHRGTLLQWRAQKKQIKFI